MIRFSTRDYDTLHEIVFRPGYPGWKPEVQEIPNGDGVVDAVKKYAHIAPKYIEKMSSCPDRDVLESYYGYAHNIAQEAAAFAGIPWNWRPDARYGALRVLDYPAGAGSALHEDFDLFTLMVYRDAPEGFVARDAEVSPTLERLRQIDPQCHLGQLGTAIGLGAATPHEVVGLARAQHSIVHFSIPDHALDFSEFSEQPDGERRRRTVMDFLNERMARSRTAFDAYKAVT